MVEWDGNIVEGKDRMQTLPLDVELEPRVVASVDISKVESEIIDNSMG